ncbi:hypothetical protein As57867_021313, partial [Aphanomyces stellatus]
MDGGGGPPRHALSAHLEPLPLSKKLSSKRRVRKIKHTGSSAKTIAEEPSSTHRFDDHDPTPPVLAIMDAATPSIAVIDEQEEVVVVPEADISPHPSSSSSKTSRFWSGKVQPAANISTRDGSVGPTEPPLAPRRESRVSRLLSGSMLARVLPRRSVVAVLGGPSFLSNFVGANMTLGAETTKKKAQHILRTLTHHNKAMFDAGQLEDELTSIATNQLATRALRKPFVLSLNSRLKRAWDVVMLLLTIYEILTAPMEIAFDHTVHALQLVVDTLLLLDVVLMFRTAYIDRYSLQEVHDTRLIRWRYLTGWFVFDCLSSFPVSYCGKHLNVKSAWGELKYFRLCILFRAMRMYESTTLSSFMAWMSHKMNVAHLRLVVMTLLYLVLHHYIACGYYMVIEYEEQLYAAHESSGDHHEAELPERWEIPFTSEDSIEIKYIGSYFQAVTVTGGFTLYPKTNAERL